MRITTKFSYEDLQHFPNDGNRYEIVDGELFVTPSPIPLHQRIVTNLAAQLWQHVRKHNLGELYVAPLDVVFTDITVLEPDVLFVSQARLHIIGEKNLSGPPDLVVEVLSESSSRLDREIKPKQYALHGVPEFWRIDPWVKTVEVFRLHLGNYDLAASLAFGDELTSPLFPGLSLPVSSLWER
jgi:Uma2 family endonuclease